MTAADVAEIASGLFFMIGLVTGFWKYRGMATGEGQAPVYVDICHRAALMYAFACVVLALFAKASAWSDAVNLTAVSVLLFFFASAVASYAIHGALRDTENQLRPPHRLGRSNVPPRVVSGFVYALAAGELGAFGVLFAGYFVKVFT
jgi:hypothetical protein